MLKKSLQTLKAISLLLVIAFACNNTFAQSVVTLSEGFNTTTFPPAGWTNNAAGASRWSRRTVGTAGVPAAPHSGAAMARFTAGPGGGGNGQQESLITPSFDLSSIGANTAHVSFWIYRDTVNKTSIDSISIYINTTNTIAGATLLGSVARAATIAVPATVATPGWYQYTYAFPPSFNTATNYVFIQGTNRGGRNIYIDDISWESYPPACTSTPNVDTIISTKTIICGTLDSAILYLKHPITGVSGITYQWESATSAGGPWTPLAGSSNLPYASTGLLTSTTYFMCVVGCAGHGSANTLVDSIIVSTTTPPNVTVAPYAITACSGTPTTLNATGALTYAWTPATALSATTGSTVIASPTNTGGGAINVNYIVTGYDAIGCYDTAHITIRVNPAPSAVITSSIPSDTICSGTQIILSAPAGGGGGGTTYAWSDGKTVRRDTLSPTATATYTVTVTRNGCSASDSVKVVVNPGTPPSVTIAPTAAVYCVGTPVMLVATASGATSFAWTPATGLSVTNNDTVYAAPTGGFGGTVYTCTVSNGSCSAAAQVTVTRSNPPTGNITTNLVGDTACTGATIILTGPAAGGGGGGGYTYAWSNGSSNRRDTILNASTSAMYILTVSNAAGCTKIDTVNITVISGTQPNLVLTPNGNAAYCTNTSGLTLTAFGAVNYAWSPATGLNTTTGSTVIATPAGGPPTVYTVTGSDASGLCKATATVTVNASNPPAKAVITANPNDSVCAGSQVILRVGGFGGGGNAYAWSNGATTRSDTFNVTTVGLYTCTVTNNAGCSTIDSIMMYFLPGINAHFGYSINGMTVTFTDSTNGATSWAWDFGDSSSSISQNPVHVYVYGGQHTVTLVATGSGSSGCNTGSATVQFTVGNVGIRSLNNSSFNVLAYPNPTNGNTTISFDLNTASAELCLINTLGQTLFSKAIYPKANSNFVEQIATDKLVAGIYLVQIKSAKGNSTIKLIKE